MVSRTSNFIITVRLWVARFALGLLALVVPALATAAPKEEAAEHFSRAMELVESGQVEDALTEFLRAYYIKPHYAVLYNIARAHSDLGQILQAQEAFLRYIKEGGQSIGDERRSAVTQAIQALETRVGRIRVQTQVAGATISVDGSGVGQTPLSQPIRVNPGVHRVSTHRPGQRPQVREVSVGSGQTVELGIDDPASENGALLAADPPSPSLAETPTRGLSSSNGHVRPQRVPPHGDGSGIQLRDAQKPAAAVLMGAGIVGIGIGAIFGLKSLSKDSESDRNCGQKGDPLGCDDMGMRLNQEALDAKHAAILSYIIGGTLAGGGALLWFTAPVQPRSERPKPIRVVPLIGTNFRGVSVEGRWR